MRARALAFLARREHSRTELARKLAEHGAREDIAGVLDALEQEGLLSDRRFAESLAHARAGRHGSLRLRAELRDKGVPEALAADVLAQARAHDLQAARTLWARKFHAPPANAAERAKQMRFLANRGFPIEVIRQVLGNTEDD